MAALPVQGRVGSPFGWRWLNARSDYHTGVDIGAPEGTPVHSVLAGTVVVAAHTGELSGYGNVVVVRHSPSLFSLYAHLAVLAVVLGQVIAEGETLGTVGRTAGTREQPGKLFAESGSHLHLEFLDRWPPAGRDENRIDPALVLGELGIIVPASGPLRLASSSSGEDERSYFGPRTRAATTTGAGVAILALALWLAVQKQEPFKRFA